MTEPPRVCDILDKHRMIFHSEDGVDDRTRFGVEHNLLTERARRWIKAERPDIDETTLYFEANKAYARYCGLKPTFAEISRAQEVRSAWEREQGWQAGHGERGGLSRPEWNLIAEHFVGANDPVAQKLFTRATEILG